MSFGDEDTAGRVLQEIGNLVQNGGFHLTKWLSNSRRVLSLVSPEERATLVQDNNLDLDSLPVERALGIYWDCERDELRIHIKTKEPVCTRRGVLSLMSSVYDPLGLVGPYIFLAKRIFQDECRLNKGWDEPLSEQNKRRWLKWVQDLDELTKFSIKRCLIDQDLTQINKIEFHHFCDASEAGYGVVSYLRIIDDDGNIHCSFLQAKSRLAPIKQITIPRLELLGAVIAVKVDAFLRSHLGLDGVRSIFWTDSMIVLHYIRNTSKRFRTFVANRVTKIHEGSSPDQWRHVDTKSNPADDASRGLEAIEMVTSSRWKQGPAFLHQNESMWPHIPDEFPGESEDKEILLSKSFSVQIMEDDFLDVFMKRYSDWFRLKKAVAWLLRFKSWLKAPQKNVVRTSIAVSDLEEAEVEIFKYVQRRHFAGDIHTLEVDRMVPKGSKVYKLDPFIDAQSVLRVGGRLKAAPISDSAKHPIILPRDHHVSELIVRHSHEKQSLHSGREYVLSVIRQKYWILRGRPLINKVLHRCVICARTRGILGKQHMADLPADRVTPNKPPFAHVGVDCFGPFLVKRGRSQEKRYGCLFTCLSIRAIHVEKLHSLESDSFINALVRFSARRGFPEKMRSDNGTNFTGTERELQIAVDNLNRSKNVQSYFLQKNIQWDFNPPAASHMGGVWERQIRTTRKVLNSILKNQILDDERLDTFFCEAEAIVNGRPLTPVSDDPEDLSPLTSNHLLLLRGNSEILPGPFSKNDAFGRRWRHVQYMADTFWTRWVREYLPILQERQKWNVRQKNLALGDIVLVVDETAPRKMWPLARVIDIYPGKDDLVRSVKLKTSSGTLVRPVAKLCHLEGATSA